MIIVKEKEKWWFSFLVSSFLASIYKYKNVHTNDKYQCVREVYYSTLYYGGIHECSTHLRWSCFSSLTSSYVNIQPDDIFFRNLHRNTEKRRRLTRKTGSFHLFSNYFLSLGKFFSWIRWFIFIVNTFFISKVNNRSLM